MKPAFKSSDLTVAAPKEIYNWRVYILAIVSSMGAFMFGYDLAFIGTAITLKPFIRYLHLTVTHYQKSNLTLFKGFRTQRRLGRKVRCIRGKHCVAAPSRMLLRLPHRSSSGRQVGEKNYVDDYWSCVLPWITHADSFIR